MLRTIDKPIGSISLRRPERVTLPITQPRDKVHPRAPLTLDKLVVLLRIDRKFGMHFETHRPRLTWEEMLMWFQAVDLIRAMAGAECAAWRGSESSENTDLIIALMHD